MCRALTAHQGRIDSARLFSTKFGRTCAKRAGMRRYLWDPQLWGFHRGPLAATSDDLEKVLASVAEQPGSADAPNGWVVFGRHAAMERCGSRAPEVAAVCQTYPGAGIAEMTLPALDAGSP